MANPRTKNYLVLLFALTTIAAAVLAWSQYLELVKLRTGGIDAKERAELQKRLWALEKRNNELQAENANLRARGTAVAEDDAAGDTDPAPPAAARPGPGGFNRRNGFGNISTLLDNPEFNKLWTQQQKDRVKITYAGLFKALNLTPDQADKLNSLLVERQLSVLDVLSAARAQGITGRDQIGNLMQQANSQIDGQIQSLLGPDGYAQYNNYLQTQPQRTQVNELQTRLAAAGAPALQDYQSQQLTQILAQNAPSGGGGGGRGGGGGFMGGMGGMLGGLFGTTVTGPTIAPTAVTQAATVLTPAQLQALQQMQQEQAAQQQILNLVRQSFNGSPGRGAAGTTPSGAATPAPTRPAAPKGG